MTATSCSEITRDHDVEHEWEHEVNHDIQVGNDEGKKDENAGVAAWTNLKIEEIKARLFPLLNAVVQGKAWLLNAL